MANNRTPLKAWVRYDYNKMMVPSSIIYRRTKPGGKESHYRELISPDPNFCCIQPEPTCKDLGYWLQVTENSIDISNDIVRPGNSVTDANCNVYKVSNYQSAIFYDLGNYSFKPIFLEKFDGSGNLLWQKRYWPILTNQFGPFSLGQVSENISIGLDGNLYIAGNSTIYKLDTDGNVIWSKVYECNNVEFCNIYNEFVQFLHLPNGKVYIVTQEEDTPELISNYYVRVTEIDPATGVDLPNTKRFTVNIPGTITPNNMYMGYVHTATPDNHLLCNINGWTGSQYYSVLFKLDANLNIVWQKVWTNSGPGEKYVDREVHDVIVDSAGNIYVTMGYNGINLVKLDSSGNVLWSKIMYWNVEASISSYRVGNLGFDSSGNIHLSGSDYLGLLGINFSAMTFSKWNPSGILDPSSVYTIYNDTSFGSRGWWTSWCSKYAEMKDDIFYAHVFEYSATNIASNQLFKLSNIPPTSVPGPFVSPVVNYTVEDIPCTNSNAVLTIETPEQFFNQEHTLGTDNYSMTSNRYQFL